MGSLRVAIDIQNLLLTKTGVGRYVYELASGFSRLNVDDEFLLFYFSRNNSIDLPFLNNTVREHRITSRQVRLMGSLWRWFSFPKIDRFLPAVDVYHFPNFFMRPHGRGRNVLTIHDLSFIRYPQYTEPRNLRFLPPQVERSVKCADAIITVSEFTRREIIDVYGVDESRVATIYEAVAPDFSDGVPGKSIDAVRTKYDLPERFILFVGTIEPRKNLLGLIEGFKIMRESSRDLADVKLVVCGMPGWLYDETLQRMEQPDMKQHIIRTGYLDFGELPALYTAASVVALPSWYEGFGFPCLEGMACGTPVLCSRDSSMSEITGDASVLVDPDNAESIADGLRKILSDTTFAEELVGKGLKRVQEFTWGKTAKQTYDVYRSVL